jgi:hypothetical protein
MFDSASNNFFVGNDAQHVEDLETISRLEAALAEEGSQIRKGNM